MTRADLTTVSRWAPAVVCCLLVGIILGGFAWYASQTRAIVQATRETQIANTHLNQQTDANTRRLQDLVQEVIEGNARIKDCTEPGGECFERGQAGQAQAIDLLTLRFVYIVACRPDHPTADDVVQILACVKQLEKSGAVTMALTSSQTAQSGRDEKIAALRAAIADALTVTDTDGTYDKTLAAEAAGMCRAIQIRQPTWWRFKKASDPLLKWVHFHPPAPTP